MNNRPEHFIILDIDGLRPDVFTTEMAAGNIPNLARLFGGENLTRGLMLPALAPAPSITFASQASLFTGEHPRRHGIVGNQFFDRFGRHSTGTPRFYAFDVGDTLSVDDAVLVFTDGLANACLEADTLYQQAAQSGKRSLVAANMYAGGASDWLRPTLTNLARFTKGGNLFGLSAASFDRSILEMAVSQIAADGLPDVLTLYWMGLDHESHVHGPIAQAEYLDKVLDPLVGELLDALDFVTKRQAELVFILCSDHGQIGVPADDRHSLRLAFPFERELGHLFDALGLDVHDFPGEDPNCDTVVAANGGMAHVYLQNRRGRWQQPPNFQQDVLPVAEAFWQAHASGRYASELQGSLAGVLLRNTERDGWGSPYYALTPQGEILSLADWFASQPEESYADPVHRLENLAGAYSGDLLLLSDQDAGFYFGAPLAGVHGGLHAQDSDAVLAYGWPGSSTAAWLTARGAIETSIQRRCALEGGRQPSTADMLVGARTLGITSA